MRSAAVAGLNSSKLRCPGGWSHPTHAGTRGPGHMPATSVHSCGSIRCVLVPFAFGCLLKDFSRVGFVRLCYMCIDENGSIDESAIPAGRAVGTQPDSSASRRGKACLERYRRASVEIFTICKRMFPHSVLEKASIDEAYLGEPLRHLCFSPGQITQGEA